jgi:fumarate reductase subunit D
MTRNFAPLWWSLFSAGGMISAMILPILVIVTGILIPLGVVGGDSLLHSRVHGFVAHPLARIALFAIIALPLFHWAHRFLYTLVELGLRSLRGPLAIACYSAAILGSVVTAAVLWRL